MGKRRKGANINRWPVVGTAEYKQGLNRSEQIANGRHICILESLPLKIQFANGCAGQQQTDRHNLLLRRKWSHLGKVMIENLCSLTVALFMPVGSRFPQLKCWVSVYGSRTNCRWVNRYWSKSGSHFKMPTHSRLHNRSLSLYWFITLAKWATAHTDWIK